MQKGGLVIFTFTPFSSKLFRDYCSCLRWKYARKENKIKDWGMGKWRRMKRVGK